MTNTPISRRTVLSSAAGGVAAAGIAAPPALAGRPRRHRRGAFAIGEVGADTLMIIVADDADAQTRAAADLVSRCIGESIGVTPQVVTESAVPDGRRPNHARLYLGVVDAVPAITAEDLAGVGSDGFVIKVAAGTIAIRGNTSWGHQHGALEFLERHVGVRWLLPTEIGEDIPTHDQLVVPPGVLTQVPSFETRVLYPFPDVEGADWDRVSSVGWRAEQQRTWGWQSRVRWKHRFNHYLWHAVSPTLYLDKERFPQYYNEGLYNRPLPRRGQRTGWQPNLSSPDLVEAAAHVIHGDLAHNPDQKYYSISANDSANFGPQDVDGVNDLGFPDASTAYWSFANALVTRLSTQHPDVTFGALAYAGTSRPPAFDIHPQIVPVLAYERFNWMDPERAAWDQQWIAAWAARAQQLGTWDYGFGSPYLVPRLYDDLQAEVYRTMASSTVVAQLTEVRPNWGEGAKPWVLSKLLWDVDRDPADLVAEWCTRAVGPTAAPHLIAYHRLWSDFWRTRAVDTAWFGAGRVFLPYGGVDYLEEVTEQDIAASRQLLDRCVTDAIPGKPRQRAEALRDLHRYYETTALSYPKLTPAPQTTTDALVLLDRLVAELPGRLELAAERAQLVEATLTDPLAGSYLPPANQSGFWTGWNAHAIQAISEYVIARETQPGPVSARIDALLAGDDATGRQLGHYLRVLADGAEDRLGGDLSFEADPIEAWSLPEGWVRDTTRARTGTASLLVPDQASSAVTQKVAVSAGLLLFSVWIHSDPARLQSGYVKLWLRFYDAAGTTRIRMVQKVCNPSISQGEWARFSIGEVITADDVAAGVTTADCWIVVDTRSELHLDDVGLQFVAD